MALCLDLSLTGEFCSIKIENVKYVGKIKQIDHSDFSVNLLEGGRLLQENISSEVLVTIETIEDNIYLIESQIISVNGTGTQILRPLHIVQRTSQRHDPRLRVESPDREPIFVGYRLFPPGYNNWQPAQVVDIARGGARITGDLFICKGELIEMKIGLPFIDQDEIVISRAVHVAKNQDGQYVISIQFLNLQENHEDQVNQFVQQGLQKIKDLAANEESMQHS